MVLHYSTPQLIKLNNSSVPLCISAIKTLGLLRRTRYIHRASRRKFVYSLPNSSTLSIPSLWAAERIAATPARHRHKNLDVRVACLRPLTKATQPVQIHPHLKIALFNTRSLNNKGLLLNEFITNNNLDFLCLTETWQNQQDYFSQNQTTPPGYSYMDKPHHHGRGGGIATIFRNVINTSAITIPDPSSFEHLVFKLSGPKPLVTAVIYRPPKPNPAFPLICPNFSHNSAPSLHLFCYSVTLIYMSKPLTTWPLTTFLTSSPSTPQPIASGPPAQTCWRSSGPSAGPGVTGLSQLLHPPSGTPSPSTSARLPPYLHSKKPSKPTSLKLPSAANPYSLHSTI